MGDIEFRHNQLFLALGAPVCNFKVVSKPILVTLPDGNQVHLTYTGDLDLPQLPKAAQYCRVIPGLTKYSLLSVVKLCKAGCKVAFTKFGIDVYFRYRVRFVLTDTTCINTGLRVVPLKKKQVNTRTILQFKPSDPKQ